MVAFKSALGGRFESFQFLIIVVAIPCIGYTQSLAITIVFARRKAKPEEVFQGIQEFDCSKNGWARKEEYLPCFQGDWTWKIRR